ncbi:hypothetical protein MTLP_00980 [Candidatus Methanoliparum sp. LAM-1]|nr:hypothetical protein MTLP_00980 [Candidatus Methanoliparum sp. LAM-1]
MGKYNHLKILKKTKLGPSIFATTVVRKYCLVRPTIENILKINSFIACMPRYIAHLVMKNMERIYYCQRNDNQNAIRPRFHITFCG